MDIMTSIEQVRRKVEEAKKINDGMMRSEKSGSVKWQEHQTIDDRLYEVLAAIGH